MFSVALVDLIDGAGNFTHVFDSQAILEQIALLAGIAFEFAEDKHCGAVFRVLHEEVVEDVADKRHGLECGRCGSVKSHLESVMPVVLVAQDHGKYPCPEPVAARLYKGRLRIPDQAREDDVAVFRGGAECARLHD